MTPSLEDYPFDEALEGREAELVGLEKLRAIRDPKLRADLFKLWLNLSPRDQAATQQADLFKHRAASRSLIDPQQPRKDTRFP